MLSTARTELGVNTRLLKVPEKEANPSPLGKLPGGTDELKTDVPTRAPFWNACRVKVPLGLKAVAKLKLTLDRLEEKLMFTGPIWGGLQRSWIRAFPDRVANPPLVTSHTEADPEKLAVRPFTVLVNGVTLPAAIF